MLTLQTRIEAVGVLEEMLLGELRFDSVCSTMSIELLDREVDREQVVEVLGEIRSFVDNIRPGRIFIDSKLGATRERLRFIRMLTDHWSPEI